MRWSGVVVAATMTLVACSGGGDLGGRDQAPPADSFTPQDLDDRIAGWSDALPDGYEETSRRTMQSAGCVELWESVATVPSLPAELSDLGFSGCVINAFNRQQGNLVGGSNVLAFLFDDVPGASEALPVTRQWLADAATDSVPAGYSLESLDPIPVEGLGDEALPGIRFSVASPDRPGWEGILHAWRTGNAVVTVGGTTTLGDLDAAAILAIARDVDARTGG